MKHFIFKFSNYLMVVFLFGSCEKVIDMDLNKAEPKIVIEGIITDQSGPYKIRLSQTVNFDEPNTFPPVTGAIVTLSDDAGHFETLKETTEPGVYTTDSIQGISGRTYTLTVSSGNDTYVAVSTMPYPVNIDTLLAKSFSGPHGSGKMIEASYSDPAGITNFHRFTLFIDGVEELAVIVDDRLQDGEVITVPIFSQPDQGMAASGDTVTVIMQSIDRNVYEYFRTLEQMSGGEHGGSVSTANPLSNIDNRSLGYFKVSTIRSKTIVVP